MRKAVLINSSELHDLRDLLKDNNIQAAIEYIESVIIRADLIQ